MPHRSNVFQRCEPLTEEQFKATWLQTLNRLCRAHGDARDRAAQSDAGPGDSNDVPDGTGYAVAI